MAGFPEKLAPTPRFLAFLRYHSTKKELKTTKSALLAKASSPLGRLWVHIKWPLLRNDRPFSIDDFSAFASWLVMGNVLWVLLGTTTFVLSAIYFLDAFCRAWSFISAFFPGKTEKIGEEAGKVAKAEPLDASFLGWLTGIVLSTGMGVTVSFQKEMLPRFEDGMLRFKDIEISLSATSPSFQAKIPELDVSLSFKKWYSGHGLICDLAVFGMHVKVQKGASLKSFLDADYELQKVKLRDCTLEIVENESATHISVFNCELPRLRGNKLLLDFFNASIATGTVNNSMFSVHKNGALSNNSVKFELKGINMGPLSSNPSLKFGWLVAGKADLSAEIRMPDLQTNDSISGSISKFLENCAAEYGQDTEKEDKTESDDGLLKGAIISIYETFKSERKMDHSDYVVVNANVRFSDLKACMPSRLPLASLGVPFITLQNLRSLVTYVNETERPIVVKASGIEKVADLDDKSSVSQTKVFDCIVSDIYEEMLAKIKVDERRFLEERAVHWSHALMGQLFLIGLGVIA